mmetsp:Transcript_1729/g.6323  ORF Transcript_1729/g.6323 Transcript_1729/m.6323 type:complete len:204 (+) Transcript_1729:689-1300(+)
MVLHDGVFERRALLEDNFAHSVLPIRRLPLARKIFNHRQFRIFLHHNRHSRRRHAHDITALRTSGQSRHMNRNRTFHPRRSPNHQRVLRARRVHRREHIPPHRALFTHHTIRPNHRRHTNNNSSFRRALNSRLRAIHNAIHERARRARLPDRQPARVHPTLSSRRNKRLRPSQRREIRKPILLHTIRRRSRARQRLHLVRIRQ